VIVKLFRLLRITVKHMLSENYFRFFVLFSINKRLLFSRFDEDRTPETWLGNAGPQDRYDPSDVIMARGIARGVDGYVIYMDT